MSAQIDGLVLSLFPGIGMLDIGFEQEGFCVVRGPDVIWGGDIREFHPPAGKFDGVIGGDPCQSHSALASLVKAKGLEPSFPDLTPEYKRVVELAQPAWFLRENVPQAPAIQPKGYDVRSFLLDHSTLDSGDGTGHEQMRRRRFWFGVRDGECPELRRWIDFALFELPDVTQAVSGDTRSVPVKLGGSGKVKATAVSREDSPQTRAERGSTRWTRQAPVTRRHEGRVGAPDKDYSPPRRTLADMCELQGLLPDWLEHQPWTMQAKRKMIGNGVPIPMARAVARAVKAALARMPS
jgi:DNA (cytosine-5)-methyltransferase 1